MGLGAGAETEKRRSSNLDVKRDNRNRIYRAITRNGGVSRPELVQLLGLSIPTVMQNVKSLFEQGLIRESGSLESTGGRKAVALSRAADARLAVGVEITRNHVGAVVVDMDGAVLRRSRTRMPFAPDAGYAAKVGAIVEERVRECGAERGSILGAGIALPGILSADARIFNTAVLPAADYRTSLLGDAVKLPCIYVNDANAAGIAEKWGADPGRNFVYLMLSNSVGGAVIWNDQLLGGDTQRAGEFGHLTLRRGGRPCYCGQKGCLYAYCNAALLSDRTEGDLSRFFELVDEGEAGALSLWNGYLDHLAQAVNMLRMAFDCEVVVGGYVGAYLEKHLPALRARTRALNSFEPDGDYVKVCRRRTEASAAGAALVHIERFIREI